MLPPHIPQAQPSPRPAHLESPLRLPRSIPPPQPGVLLPANPAFDSTPNNEETQLSSKNTAIAVGAVVLCVLIMLIFRTVRVQNRHRRARALGILPPQPPAPTYFGWLPRPTNPSPPSSQSWRSRPARESRGGDFPRVRTPSPPPQYESLRAQDQPAQMQGSAWWTLRPPQPAYTRFHYQQGRSAVDVV